MATLHVFDHTIYEAFLASGGYTPNNHNLSSFSIAGSMFSFLFLLIFNKPSVVYYKKKIKVISSIKEKERLEKKTSSGGDLNSRPQDCGT